MHTFEITDRELVRKVERCATERAPCMIVADRSFKYLQHLEDLLDHMKGDARQSVWRVLLYSLRLTSVFGCIGMASGEPPFDRPLMRWHYEHANGGIVIHFDPC